MRLNWNNIGYGLGEVGNAIKERDLADESTRLNQKMDDSTTYKANGLAMPDRQTAENYADYNNKIVAEDEQTFGGGLSSAAKTAVSKEQTYTRADYYADMGRKASGLGMLDKAEAYDAKAENIRDKEWQRGRLEKSDQRAAESHDQSMAKGAIDLNRAKAEEESRLRIDGFNTALSEEYSTAMKAGKQMPLSRIKELAVEHKLRPEEMLKAYSNVVGMDEAEAGAVLATRARIAKEAARGGLDNMVNVYETNPLFNDGMKLEVKRGKGGQVTLLQNGQKLFDGSENGAMGYMLKWVVDPMSAFEYDAQVRTAQLQQRKLESEIGENQAQQSNALASAAKTRAETGVIKQGGGGLGDRKDYATLTGKGVNAFLERMGAEKDALGNYKLNKAQQTMLRDTDYNKEIDQMVRGGMSPYEAADAVFSKLNKAAQASVAQKPVANPNRKPLSTFSQ